MDAHPFKITLYLDKYFTNLHIRTSREWGKINYEVDIITKSIKTFKEYEKDQINQRQQDKITPRRTNHFINYHRENIIFFQPQNKVKNTRLYCTMDMK